MQSFSLLPLFLARITDAETRRFEEAATTSKLKAALAPQFELWQAAPETVVGLILGSFVLVTLSTWLITKILAAQRSRMSAAAMVALGDILTFAVFSMMMALVKVLAVILAVQHMGVQPEEPLPSIILNVVVGANAVLLLFMITLAVDVRMRLFELPGSGALILFIFSYLLTGLLAVLLTMSPMFTFLTSRPELLTKIQNAAKASVDISTMPAHLQREQVFFYNLHIARDKRKPLTERKNGLNTAYTELMKFRDDVSKGNELERKTFENRRAEYERAQQALRSEAAKQADPMPVL